MLYCLDDRESFNALRAPFGADLRATLAPDFFGVRLEKRQVQLAAKAADEKIFEAFGVLVGEGLCCALYIFMGREILQLLHLA